MDTPAVEELQQEIRDLRIRLEEAEATVRAISSGEVDAFIVRQGADDQVLVLDGVDRPYRLLIERMQQGAATLTADGALFYVNRRLAELLMVPAPSLLGTPLSDFIAASSRPAFGELLRQGLAGDAEGEFLLQRPDGALFPALLTVSALLEHDTVLCLVVTDLSQQKRQELERERLVQEQSARAAAEQSAAVLREADRRKDEFLAMLAHELRNPLAPIRNGMQILNRVGADERATQSTRDMIGRQLESLIRLVDDLLDVGRVSQGKIKLRTERIELRQMVTRAIESCRAVVDERGHRVELTLPDRPMPVEADPVRMTQIITNLLNNAAKFTPPGGVIWVSVEPNREARCVALRVRDNGVGISPEMLPLVFDLFIQADPSFSRSEGGLGIGLTLVRRLVELHGGRVEAASDGLGRGCEFSIHLPLLAESATDLSAGQDNSGARREPIAARRILVVDDNRDAAESLAMLLRLQGHDVRLAYDGHQVLTVLHEFVPDVLLLDIGLPGMDGYEVARHVRAQDQLQHVRIVALSGYGSEEDQRRSGAAGFHSHLIKPVEWPSLEAVLASLPSVAQPEDRFAPSQS